MTEPFIRPDVRQFLDWLNALPGPRVHEVEPAEARAMTSASRDLWDAPVGELALIRDLACPGPAGEIRLRLFDSRTERGAGPLFLFLHGGGFVFGDLDSHAPFCAEMARALDLPVLAVDYRLAPENPWPAGPEDAIAAARWAAGGPEALGREVTGLVVGGDSAGGNLAIVASLALRDEPAGAPVLAQWLIYPAADMARGHPSRADFGEGYLLTHASMDWFDACYGGDPADWRYAPMVKSQQGMPPTLMQTAGLDPLRDQGRAYAAACVEAGVPTVYREAEGIIHGFINLRKVIPSAANDIAAGVAALKLLLAKADAP